jgi:hypothetical protein
MREHEQEDTKNICQDHAVQVTVYLLSSASPAFSYAFVHCMAAVRKERRKIPEEQMEELGGGDPERIREPITPRLQRIRCAIATSPLGSTSLKAEEPVASGTAASVAPYLMR